MYNNKKVLIKNNKGKKIIRDLFISIKKKPNNFLTKEQLKNKQILIIDDVFDTGNTMMSLGNYLSNIGIYSDNFKIGCVYYKPINNVTTIIPHYYEQKREEWIVFPHELMGLTEREVEFKLRGWLHLLIIL